MSPGANRDAGGATDHEMLGVAPSAGRFESGELAERMLRLAIAGDRAAARALVVKLGDQSEDALAKRIGAERAHAIRGDGWGSRTDSSECPPQSSAK